MASSPERYLPAELNPPVQPRSAWGPTEDADPLAVIVNAYAQEILQKTPDITFLNFRELLTFTIKYDEALMKEHHLTSQSVNFYISKAEKIHPKFKKLAESLSKSGFLTDTKSSFWDCFRCSKTD